jgi:hypothetical protein
MSESTVTVVRTTNESLAAVMENFKTVCLMMLNMQGSHIEYPLDA